MGSVAFHPTGRFLAAGGMYSVEIWEVSTKSSISVLDRPDIERAVGSVRFSPNGKLLAAAGADKLIKVWDVSRLEKK
jgi:WD40 repeat protein